ncbi:EAL domain-containing protein [Mycobacterium sp. 236(2023)]|uniref:sensor domain-containing phosphodiesterase n=1 Tax=Mycobacterium sp. 236(2023) TaxID=3038163 RepID=UPI002414D049|nr:EAL domain-containing protein [Mycobacterium sp. 236(2023)]MDG4666671.1 EAL domain-containing protein [Mycobacterium sp. 236(2023)]
MRNLIAAVNASIDKGALMRRIAEQMCLFTPKADGAAVSILTPNDEFVVVSAYGLVESVLGLTLPVEDTFQGRAVRTGRPQVSADAPSDKTLRDDVRAIGSRLGIRTLVVIPLLHRDTAIGALSISATTPNKFDERDIAAMTETSKFISGLISAHTELSSSLDNFLDNPYAADDDSTAQFLASLLLPDVAQHDQLHKRMDALLKNEANLDIVFQPIVDLRSGESVGFEGLSRFPAGANLSPLQWFDTARRLGRSLSLELAALRRLIDGIDDLPPCAFVAVNLSPLTAMEPSVQELLLSVDPPLVVEITEHEPFPDDLPEALAPLRAAGIRLAIDDAGAGFASFNQLLRLRPDIIKIDGDLTYGIESDPVRRALASSIVRLGGELGAVTVSESVEDPQQVEALRDLGVDLGQGYLFGRPSTYRRGVAVR